MGGLASKVNLFVRACVAGLADFCLLQSSRHAELLSDEVKVQDK